MNRPGGVFPGPYKRGAVDHVVASGLRAVVEVAQGRAVKAISSPPWKMISPVSDPSGWSWAQQTLHPGVGRHRSQELRRDLAFQLPVAVLGEARMVPARIVDPQAHEAAEQQVELRPLHQLPLRADRIERPQQHRPQQRFRRDRGPTHPRIEPREVLGQALQRPIGERPDSPQRMIAPNTRLQIHIENNDPERLAEPRIAFPSTPLGKSESCRDRRRYGPFSTAC